MNEENLLSDDEQPQGVAPAAKPVETDGFTARPETPQQEAPKPWRPLREVRLEALWHVANMDEMGDTARKEVDASDYFYYLSTPASVGDLALFGRDVMENYGHDGEEPMEWVERMIAQMPEGERRTRYQTEFQKLQVSGKDTVLDWQAFVGRMAKDDFQEQYRTAKAQQEEVKRGREVFIKNIYDSLPALVMDRGTITPEQVAQLSQYDDSGQLLASIQRAQRAGVFVRGKLMGGASYAEYEAAVYNRVQELKREWRTSPGWKWNAPKTEDDFVQQAKADVSESYKFNFTRADFAELAGLLRGEDGKLDEVAMDALLEALRGKAEGEQGLESEFWRNFGMALSRFAADTLDEAERTTAKTGWRTLPSPSPFSLMERVKGNELDALQEQYSPDVEKLRSHFELLEDTRLKPHERASAFAGMLSELGTQTGHSAPVILAGAATGGLATGVLLGGAMLLPSQINREVGNAYREGKLNPELYGILKGTGTAFSEGIAGAAFMKVPGVSLLFDKLALGLISVPVAGRAFGAVQGSFFGRMVASAFGESASELVVEDMVADGFTWCSVNGLRKLGIPLDEERYAGLAERWDALAQDERQTAATITFCVLMGLTGAPAQHRAATAFASNRENLLATGMTRESAESISLRVQRGELTGAAFITEATKAYQRDVLEDPEGARKRLKGNRDEFLSQVEAEALARERVLQAGLHEMGVIASAQADEKGMYRVTVADAVKRDQDAQTWEKNKKGQAVAPKGYIMPTKEVMMSEAQLTAYAQYALTEMEVKRMKEIRSAALALDAADKVNAQEQDYAKVVPLSSIGSPVLSALAASEGAMTMPVMRTMADAAQNAASEGQQLIDGVSNAQVVRTPQDLNRRLDIAVQKGEETQERADMIRAGMGGGAAAIRFTASTGARSRIVINDGHTNTRNLTEDVVESIMHNAKALKKGEGSPEGQEFIRKLATELEKVRQQVKNATGEDIMPGFNPDAADLAAVTEYFSHFAQSAFYQTADTRDLSDAAKFSVQFMDSALTSASLMSAMQKGYKEWLKTEEGKAFAEGGGLLADLMQQADIEMGRIYEESRVTAANLATVMQARAMARGEASASLAEVQEMDALAEAEQVAAESVTPSPVDVPESVSEDVSTESLAEMIEMERAPLTQDGHLVPPLGATAETDAEGTGRGLLYGEFARMPDGSVQGVAAVADIHLSTDVPQFKRTSRGEAAGEDGTTHKLSGKYRHDLAGLITIWRRKDGRLEVVSGRHRLAHAKACGETVVAVKVFDEDATHDAQWAKLLDVEQNIFDRTASVQDVCYFFRNTQMSETEAAERGLMPKAENGEPLATGTMGITIARRACEEIYVRFMNGALTRKQAYFIATLGVDERGQELAAQMFAKKKSEEWVKAYVHEAEAARAGSDAPQQFDLFGMDESWAQEAAKVADYVAKARRAVKDQLDILTKATKLKDKAEQAKKLGVTLKTEKDVQRRLETLTLLDARLESMDSSLSLGGRAAAWDGKSSVDVDALAQAGGSSMSIIGESAKIWSKYADRAFKGRDDGKMRAELDASKARVLLPKSHFDAGLFKKIKHAYDSAEYTVYENLECVADVIEDSTNKAGITINSKMRDLLDEDEIEDFAVIMEGTPVSLDSSAHDVLVAAHDARERWKSILKAELEKYGVELEGHHHEKALLTGRVGLAKVHDAKTTVRAFDGKYLDDVLDFPELFEAYPELRFVMMARDLGLGLAAASYSHWDAISREIGKGEDKAPRGFINMNEQISSWGNEEEARSIILHEVQHAIQHIEGFAKGSNERMAGSYEAYMRHAGEIEARNVQHRMGWSAEERAATPFNDTLGHPGEAITTFALVSPEEGQRIAREFNALEKSAGVRVETPGVYTDGLKDAIAYAKERYNELKSEINAGKPIIMRVAGERKEIQLSGKGFAEVRRHSADRRSLACLCELRALCESAIYINSAANSQKDKPSKEDIAAYHYFVSKGYFVGASAHDAKNSDVAYVCIVIAERTNGEFFYDVDATNVEEIDNDKETSDELPATRVPNSGPAAPGGVPKGRVQLIKEFVNYINAQKSTMSLALDNGVAAMRGAAGVSAKEEAMQRMLRSVERAREQWAAPWKGNSNERAQARGHLMGLAMGIYRALPPGYKLQLDALLRRGAVLERMIADGKLTGQGQVSKEELAELNDAVLDRLAETWQEQVGEYALEDEFSEVDERRSRGGVNTTSVTKKEQQRLWREAAKEATARVGMERMEDVYREIAEAAAAQVKAYLKDMEMQKLTTLIDRFTPKVDKKTRKLKPGSTDAEFYREVAHLRDGIMSADSAVRDEKMQALLAQLEPLQAKGDGLTPEDEAKRDALDAELSDWTVFGAIATRGYADVRKARELLGARAAMRRGFWQARKEAETARLRALMNRAVRGMGVADENTIARQQEDYKQSSWQQFKGLPAYAMSIAQLMDSMSKIPGLGEFAAECRDAIARGHLGLIASENDLYTAMSSFLETQLGLKDGKDKANFLERLQKLEQTAIAPLADVVRVDEMVSVEDAERWLSMTAAEREDARLSWDIDPQGMKPLPEGAIPALREAYEENKTGAQARERAEQRAAERRAQGKPGEVNIKPHEPKAKFRVHTEFRPKTKKDKLRISRNQALNVLLLCEQPRYVSNADSHGYTADVLAQLREFVGEDILRFGYWMREYMSNSGLAEVYEAREGVPFPAEEYYWTGHFDRTADMSDKTALDAQISTMSGKYGMLKTRVDHDLTFDLSLGATNVFMGTMAQQFNYIHMGGLTAKWRRMLANRAFASSLRVHLGEARFRALKDGINLLDMQGVVEATAQRTISTLIGKVQSVHAPAVLAGSLTTIIKQFSASMHAASCPGVSVVQLIPQLIADRCGAGRMTYGKMLRERAFAERITHNEARRQVYTDMLELGSDVTWSRLADLSRRGMATLEWVDVRSNVVSMTALYNILWRRMEKENRETGGELTEEQMHALCMQAVETTLDQAMMPMLTSQRSLLQAYGGNGVFGKLNMYMGGEVMNKFGLVVRDYHKAGGGVKGMFKAWPFLATMSMAEQTMMMLIDLLRGKEPDEEEDWVMWWACNLATGISGLGLLNGVPLLGEAFHHITGGYAQTNTLAKAVGLDVIGSGKKLYKMATDDKEYGFEDWFLRSQNFLRPFTSLWGGWSGGVHSTTRFFTESTGVMQSINAAMNAVRPFVERAKNQE